MKNTSLIRNLGAAALLAMLATNAAAAPLGPSFIYYDAAQNNWNSNPFGATMDLNHTTTVKNGTKSIAAAITGGAVQFNHSGAQVVTSPFESLSFWVHGGATGGHKLQVTLMKNLTEGPRVEVLPDTGAWKQITIPLASLGAANATTVDGMRIWEGNGVTSTFYLDDIQFNRPATYALTYNGNGNTAGTAPAATAAEPGADITVSGAATLARTDYEFIGWNAKANGTGMFYAADATLSISANTTLYAQWNYIGTTFHAVTYAGNGNTGGDPPFDNFSPYIPASTVTVLGNTEAMTKDGGFVFAGWNTAANGSGTHYAAGATFSITGDVTLYAKWVTPVTLTYIGNGNTGGDPPTDANSPYVPGATVTVLGNTGNLTKTGGNLIFAGWNMATDGSGTNYLAGATFAILSDTILYAKWADGADTAWDGGGANTLWTNAANWNTMADGSGTNPAVSPSTGEIATFNISTLNAAVTTTLNANLALGGFVVNNTGTTRIYTDNAASRIINLGAGGITINPGAGSVQFAETNANLKKLQFVLTANQSWINNGSGTLTLASDAAPNIANGGFRLTFGGSGNISTMGRFGGTGGYTKAGAGTLTSTGGSSGFTGSLILEDGIWDAQTFANVNTVSDIGKGSATNQAGDLVFAGGTLRHSAANVAATNRLFTIGNANGLTATIDSSAVSATNTMSFTGTGALAYGGSGARTLTLKGSNTGTNTFAPVIGDGTGGATSLVKDGTGAWTVSGANNYAGATTILDGTLSVTAPNFADASTVTIGTSAGSPAVLNLPNAGTDNVAVLIIDGVSMPAGLYDKDNSGGAITGDGKINVGAVVPDYDSWKTATGVTGGPNDDDDGDGVKNFDEYAFGLNPQSGASASPISSPLNKATGIFKYTRRKQSLTGLTYTYGSSTTLAGAWPSFTPDSEISNNGDPVEEITVDVPNALLANPALFIRVKAVQP